MKVLINRKPVEGPFGGGNHFVRAFHEYGPEFGLEVTTQLNSSVEAILLFDPRYDELGISINEIAAFKKRFPQTRVVHRVNECDARKNAHNDIDPLLRLCSEHTDVTVFVSDWLLTYHTTQGWACQDTRVIYNGLDRNIFHARPKLDNGKINLVTHHWSDNWYKGGSAYEWLDNFIAEYPEFTFTYIGRHKLSIPNTKVFPPMFGMELANELGRYDVYITGTKYDPAPNHVLEVVEYMPTLVHAEGGGAVELAPENVYNSHQELKDMLLNHSWVKNKFVPPTWRETIKQFAEILKGK